MAGLAAVLRTTSVTPPKAATLQELRRTSEALSRALIVRGAEHAHRTHGRLTVLIRSALPLIHEVDGCAVVVDGVAEVGTLIRDYVDRGPSGLVGGVSAYALILADPVRDGLVLARNGDGAPLYYARTRSGALVASEPAALIAAGVSATPDTAVVERFLTTGRCDDTSATFFAEIKRVLPGQVVLVTAERSIVHESMTAAHVRAQPLRAMGRRVGCRLSTAQGAATVLDAALRQAEETDSLPLPIYSTYVPGLAGGSPDALLAPLPRGSFRHRATPCDAFDLDLDGFLRDVGEPMPDLESYLIWATARATGGEVDALLDGATHGDHLPRLADRVASRYGVELLFPCRVPLATAIRPADGRVAKVMARMSNDQLAPLVHARLRPQVTALAGLFGGRRVDAEALFRRLMVERWLGLIAPVVAPVRVPSPALRVNGKEWSRQAVATEALRADDLAVERFAFHATEAADGLRQQWYLLVAAKPIAVAQGLARDVWQLRPGTLALLLGALSRREPWRVQALIDHSGTARAAGAVLLPQTWASRLVDMRGIGFPRAEAVPPANVSVVCLPNHPNLVAEQLSAALEKTLSDAAWGGFRGCAIIGAGQLLGWSGPGDPEIAMALAAGDPFGNGQELTPLVIAAHAPASARIAAPARKAKTARR